MTGSQPDYRALLQRSLDAIDELERKLAATQQQLADAAKQQNEPIAVVGIGCRFPGGASTPETFWKLLRDGVDAVTEIPADRWNIDDYYNPDPDAVGYSYTKWGGFLKNVDRFDAAFFGISPREAASLDPQQRLLLEVTWEALEHAAIAPSKLAGSRTSVFVGISGTDYYTMFGEAVGTRLADAYMASGTSHSVAAGRISYFLGLHGPSIAVDTACSSSLVALHDGVQSLRRRETDLALAGGVNLMLSPTGSIVTSRARMMSFDGRCKTFDQSADGYVRAEGCGMMVLKRLSDARRDNDPIVAIIRGSALNQDGRSSGLTAPNGAAQEQVVREALANAGLTPDDISAVEAHGTGTSLGDPIEVNALGAVFGKRDPARPLVITSGKTNIGHSEAAAGIAGVIKAILALQHRQIPPHLHVRTPNPLIPWDTLPIRVPQSLEKWETPDGAPRRIGVSSFGFSGTNGHVVLEESDVAQPTPAANDCRSRLLALSAQTPAALRAQAERFRDYLCNPGNTSWRDITYTAGYGRSHLSERLAVVADGPQEAATKLQAFLDEQPSGVARGSALSTAPEVGFMFTGQGAQFFGMGRELHASQPVFREALQACAAVADPLLGRSLIGVMLEEDATSALLNDTAFTQPALFAIEYALAQQWRAWGVTPTVVMGHSVGEYVAACLAGVFSMEDGLTLIAHRGRLMSRLPRDGSMAAVFADEATVTRALEGLEAEIGLGAINGPANIVISGRTSAVDKVLARLAGEGIDSQRLNVSHAFHSPLMEPMLDEFEAIASKVTFTPPRIGIVSNVTGRMVGDEIATSGYWRRHIRDAVRFSDGVATLHQEKIRTVVEIGPSPTLTGMAKSCPHADQVHWLTSLRKGVHDIDAMLATLAELYVAGQPIDWEQLTGEPACRTVLPTYAFQRERYWHDLRVRRAPSSLSGSSSGHPLLGERLASPVHVYQSSVSLDTVPWLADHQILGYVLFPATGFLELALAAGRRALGTDDVVVENLSFQESLDVPGDGSVPVQVIVSSDDGGHHVSIYSAVEMETPTDEVTWRLHATATVSRADTEEPRRVVLDQGEELDLEAHYEDLARVNAVYGPAFRGLKQMWRQGQTIVGRLELPAIPGLSSDRMSLHPALLDACLHTAGVGLPWDNGAVPVGVDRYRVFRFGVTSLWSQVTIPPSTPDATGLRVDIAITDDDGVLVAEIEGLEFHRAPKTSFKRGDGADRPEWLLEVDWVPLPVDSAVTPGSARWLIVGEDTSLAHQVAAELRERGDAVTLATHGQEIREDSSGWHFDSRNTEHYRRLLTTGGSQGTPAWTGILWMNQLSSEPSLDDVGSMTDAHEARITPLLAAIPAIGDTSARLWLMTRGSQAVLGSVPNLADAPLWGVGNVIASEYPALRPVRIDLDPVVRDDEVRALVAAICADDTNERVALRAGQRYVARLTQGVLAAPEVNPRRLEIEDRGVLENLLWRKAARIEPGPGEVEIRVHATGLNFRDVLNALGMYPGDPGPLGNECAGVVTAIGAGVEDFAVGDAVVSMVNQSFATFVVAPAVMTVHKPANLTFAEAATIPVTFLTAEYSLSHLGRMSKGDRVLVHAATGGVGMAAMQLALRAGAEIFATAGSPVKRELARALGAHHISDSRSLAFVDDFGRLTDGEGVDIVINSLAGDFIPGSLGLLRKGGRFIEIGKTGIWDAATVDASYPGLEYYPLYLGEIASADPMLVRDMLKRLMDDFASGVLKPLPQTIYPIERAEEAFRFMGQGRHTGKIVLTQRPSPAIRTDRSYLVTGGLGGLGLISARGLIERGATHVVLMSRRAPSPAAYQAIEEMKASGATVAVMLGDISVEADVVHVLNQIREALPPLGGILHAAGFVDDGMLAEQRWERFERVMAPKVAGSWFLHTHTRDLPLDFFVMFSSGAALLGSPGQSNYAAANAYMDALAFSREAEGRPALSINWGTWTEVGMAAAMDEQHRRRWEQQGIRTIRPGEGVQMMFDVMAGGRSAEVAILPLDRSRIVPELGPFFERLVAKATVQTKGETQTADLLRQISAHAVEERPSVVTAYLCDQLIRVLAVDPSTRFRTDQAMIDLGLDSLMAMELRNKVQLAAKVRLSVADLIAGATIDDVVKRILEGMHLSDGGGGPEENWEEGSL